MNHIHNIVKHRANTVHLAGWLVIDRIEQLEFGKCLQVAVSGELHAKKPQRANVPPADTSYPVLFTGKAAGIVLDWAKVRQEHPVKMSIDGRLFRKGGNLIVLTRYVEILEVITGPLSSLNEATRPTLDR